MDAILGFAIVFGLTLAVGFFAWLGRKTATDMLAIFVGTVLAAYAGFELAHATRDYGGAWHLAAGLTLVALGVFESEPRRLARAVGAATLIAVTVMLAFTPSGSQAIVAILLAVYLIMGIANDVTYAIRVGLMGWALGAIYVLAWRRTTGIWWEVVFGAALLGLGLAARDRARHPHVRRLALVLECVCWGVVLISVGGYVFSVDLVPQALLSAAVITAMVAFGLRHLRDAPTAGDAPSSEPSAAM